MRTPEKLTLSKSFCKQRGMSRRSKGGEEQRATRSFVCFSVCLHSGGKNQFVWEKKKLETRMDGQCTEKAGGLEVGKLGLLW